MLQKVTSTDERNIHFGIGWCVGFFSQSAPLKKAMNGNSSYPIPAEYRHIQSVRFFFELRNGSSDERGQISCPFLNRRVKEGLKAR